MKKIIVGVFLLGYSALNAQSYPPAAGQPGSTAISCTSPVFVAWATNATIVRGKQDISNPTSPLATFGTASEAVGSTPGTSTMSVVSLGDGGSATLTFANAITNGTGYDFAVFENSFNATFLELAFVEVSSDGVNFFRFPSHSETQTTTQIGGFGALDCRYLNNLAGKYQLGYGTPFDLSDVPNNALLNKSAVTHVRVIDVVGSINASYARYDSFGNKINDPFTTPFASSGFDLDAVGVINQAIPKMLVPGETITTVPAFFVDFQFYPNPASDELFFKSNTSFSVRIFDMTGRVVLELEEGNHRQLDVRDLKTGNYVLEVIGSNEKITNNIVIN